MHYVIHFAFHYYKDERISVVGIYHIHVVGPAMPRPAPRLGTRSFQLQCVASTTHWGLQGPMGMEATTSLGP